MAIVAPHAAFSGCIAHYWRSLGNRDRYFVQLPDGCVDVVLEQHDGTLTARAYGTSTQARVLPLCEGADYLGIRFHPGQARHALPLSIRLLTDATVPLADIVTLRPPERIALASPGAFAAVDAWLGGWLPSQPPQQDALDTAIACLQHDNSPSIATIARRIALSTRQFERRFAAAIGVPPSVFVAIARFRRAHTRIAQHPAALADIAYQCGYSDQSHMHREFRRFAGCTPGQWRANVAFVQDSASAGA